MSTNATGAGGSLPASDAWRMSERASYWLVQVAPFVLALVVYAAAFVVMNPDATGDEPHYMVAAQSLAYDGDLDLTNDYASRERTLEVFGTTLAPSAHAADYKDSGQLRPVRGIGMATLLAPAIALGGETGVRLLIVLIAALLADQLFRLLRDLGFRLRYAALGWAAVALCYPIIIFSSQIYPELPGALLIVVALRVMLTRASSPMALALGSTAAAMLVWLHVRFLPLSACVLLGLVIAACRARRRGPALPRAPGLTGVVRAARVELPRYARVLPREWRTVTVPLFVPYGLDLALFALVSQHLYGSPNPTAPYREFSETTVGSGGLSFLYEFALADVFNATDGWIPYVPVHWLGLAALGCLVLRFGWAAAACVAVAVAYELGLASLGVELGFDFPARYLVILIPLIAIPIALVIQEVRASLIVFIPLLAVSLTFAAAAVQEHRHLYPASELPRLFAVRTTAAVFPNTSSTPIPTSYVLSPGEFPPLTGRMQGGDAVAEPGDGPDFLLSGPYVVLKRGTYRATFQLAGTGATPESRVGLVDATSTPPLKTLASKVVTAGELKPRRMGEVTLEFSNPNGGLIQTRVYYRRGTLRAGQVRVEPEEPSLQTFGRLPDWPKALGWVLGTIAAGWLLVLGMKRAQREAASDGTGTGAAPTTN